MLGLNILQYYTVKYIEKHDRVIAQTTGAISDIDRKKLADLGWVKVNNMEFYYPKEKSEPESPDLAETDIFIENTSDNLSLDEGDYSS